MKGFRYKHKENNFQSVRFVGFSVMNVFEIREANLEEIEEHEILQKALMSGFFSNKYISSRSVNDDFEIKEFKNNLYHGPFDLEKVDYTSYKKLTYTELLQKIEIIQKSNDWEDDDLQAFIGLFNIAKNAINHLELLAQNFYYLDMYDLEQHQLTEIETEYNFFSCFIQIVIINKKKNEIILFDFGDD